MFLAASTVFAVLSLDIRPAEGTVFPVVMSPVEFNTITRHCTT